RLSRNPHMETNALDAIQSQLQDQRTKLAAKADRYRDELQRLDEGLARIDAALAALSGAALPPSTPKSPKKDRRRTLAPAASRTQVTALMLEELSQHPILPEEDLKARVEQTLVASGHTRMGYALRFKESL